MKKLLTALTFASGAIFGMFFSTKKGEQIRKEMARKKGSEEKLEVVKEEAGAMAKSFWNTVKGPLKRGFKDAKKEMEKIGKEYGTQAKKRLSEWKEKAEKEFKEEVKGAAGKVKRVAEKATSAAKNQMKVVKKKLK